MHLARQHTWIRKGQTKDNQMVELSLASDNPIGIHSNDHLGFDRYLDPLVSLLANPKTETPFTVGVFGTWGSGKTSLLKLLDARLENDHPGKFLRVWFNPWVHRAEPNLLVPLLHTLHDTLDAQPLEKFKASASKIFDVLVRLGAGFFLKHVTAEAVSMEDLDKLEEKYLKTHGRVESEMRKLRTTLQTEATKLAEGGTKLVLIIDDLDRCDPTQIVDLLDSVKLFFDLKDLFIILAVDKEVVDRGVQIKYKDFQFAKDRTAAIGAEYLEKMVQLPLSLFPLHRTQVETFVSKFNPPAALQPHLTLLRDTLDPNPRKLKRALNILSLIAQVKAATPALHNLMDDLIARLIVLQVQSGEIFSEVVRQPDLLLALEATYAGDLDPKSVQDYFKKYGVRAKEIQDFCQLYYAPGNYLSTLFRGKPFETEEKGAKLLPVYLAMFGGKA
jgi:predicted KAP-like P-loop ATPase